MTRWPAVLLVATLCLDPGCGGGVEGNPPPPRDAGAPEAGLAFPDGGPPAGCAAGTQSCGKECCTAAQLCLEGSCRSVGAECDELWPCPAGFFCEKGLGKCVSGSTKCEYHPPVGQFSPKLKWAWSASPLAPAHSQVMMAPMVANLSDDNGDGKVDRNDIPDVVFNTFAGSDYWGAGVLRAISGDGKKELFAVTDPALATTPGAGVAIADLDNDGRPEIVTCAASNAGSGQGGAAIAFTAEGKLKWRSTDPKVVCGFASPAIADLDGDGAPEVVVRYAVLEGASGKTRWVGRVDSYATSPADTSTVADLDEDGKPEVVGGNVVYRSDGKVLWEDSARPDGYPAIADLDGDGRAEVVTASSADHSLRAYHADGKLYWGPVDINQGKADPGDKCKGCGGGPPTIADFDGDGKPEIAAAAGYGYVVFEHDGKPKWFSVTQDLSSRVTGSAVFDFEGDGKAEVVYGDELMLRIYRGGNGNVLYSRCNTSGTLWEYPVIVDVDNDGHAEIVVANNNYAFQKCGDGSASATGIRVIADTQNNWVRTRRIWNQHSYHVTNIDEDGRVPKQEQRNWDNPALNNFRQNVQPGGLFDAADLTGATAPKLEDQAKCGSQIRVAVEVKNQGAAKVAAGVSVALYGGVKGGAAKALATAQTKGALLPGQSELVSFDVKTPADFVDKTIELWAVVDDDGTGKGTHNECVETNNKVELAGASGLECRGIE
jgi:hypothetical protein